MSFTHPTSRKNGYERASCFFLSAACGGNELFPNPLRLGLGPVEKKLLPPGRYTIGTNTSVKGPFSTIAFGTNGLSERVFPVVQHGLTFTGGRDGDSIGLMMQFPDTQFGDNSKMAVANIENITPNQLNCLKISWANPDNPLLIAGLKAGYADIVLNNSIHRRIAIPQQTNFESCVTSVIGSNGNVVPLPSLLLTPDMH